MDARVLATLNLIAVIVLALLAFLERAIHRRTDKEDALSAELHHKELDALIKEMTYLSAEVKGLRDVIDKVHAQASALGDDLVNRFSPLSVDVAVLKGQVATLSERARDNFETITALRAALDRRERPR